MFAFAGRETFSSDIHIFALELTIAFAVRETFSSKKTFHCSAKNDF
jgi:hypothetical protein